MNTLVLYNLNQVTNIIIDEVIEDNQYVFQNYYETLGWFSWKKKYFKDKKYRWVYVGSSFNIWYDSDEELMKDEPYLMIDNGKTYRKARIMLMFSDGTNKKLYFVTNEDMYKELEKIKSMMTRPEALYHRKNDEEK